MDSSGRRAHTSTALSSKCEQCHVVSGREKRKTDLFRNDSVKNELN